MSRAVGHVAALGLRLGGEQKRTRTGPHQTRSGHVSVPDPRLGPVQGPGMFCPVTLGPPCGRPGPHIGGGVWIPFQGSGLHMWRSGINLGGADCISKGLGQTLGSGLYIRGPTLSHGGSDSLLMLWSIPPSLDTWRLRTRPIGGIGRCCGPRIAA
jgi:hypothetical protein